MIPEKIIESLKTSKETLIYGAPGTGKTHFLLEIIKFLINQEKIEPGELLVFCFNRRWSKIIREKTTELINRSIFEIPAETFYSFSISLIEKSKILTGAENFDSAESYKKKDFNFTGNVPALTALSEINVINSTQQWQLLKNIIRNLSKKDYPITSKIVNKNPNVLKSFFQEIFDYILRAQENLFTPEYLLKKITPYNNPLLSEINGIYYKYISNLRDEGLFNYGMLLQEAVNILKTNNVVREYYNKKYKYIIIDELNEINNAQFEIVKQMSEPGKIYFGNDDESIYAFRGSHFEYFKEAYLNVKTENKVLLENNYRSVPLINEICCSLIMKNNDRIQKESKSVSEFISIEDITVREFFNSIEETEFICDRIEFLKKIKGVNLEKIAIIIKGLGYETYLIESSLNRKGIPYYRRGSRSLLDNYFIKYIINFSRLIVILKEYDSGIKLLNNPVNFNSEIEILIDKILTSEIIYLEPLFYKGLKECFRKIKETKKDLNMLDFLLEIKNKNLKFPIRKEENYKRINDFLDALTYFIENIDLEVLEFLFELIKDKRIGIADYCFLKTDEDKEKGDTLTVIGDFLKNASTFRAGCKSDCNIVTYINFIDDIIENQFLEEIEESTEELFQEGKINILSFHQCKGLEFEAVFIPFMNKNYLPAKFELPQVFDIQLFDYLKGAKKLEENQIKNSHREGELRLFYNGISRAKKYLHVTCDSSKEKSIFFEDLKMSYRSMMKNIHYGECNIQDNNLLKKCSGNKIKKEYPEDIISVKPWQIKKRLMVSMARLENELKVDFKDFLEKIIYLRIIYPEKEWWNNIEPTKNLNVLFETEKRKSFSFSEINSYRSCPLRYEISYLFKISEEENLSVVIGKLYHRILNIFFNFKNKAEADYSWERLESIVKEQFANQYFDFNSIKLQLEEKALLEFKNFYLKFLPQNPSASAMEKIFSFNIKNNEICDDYIIINGRIDQINLSGENEIEVIDYKSGSGAFSESDIREELQLKIYRLAFDLSDDLLEYRNLDITLKYIILGNLRNSSATVPQEQYDPFLVTESIYNILKEIKNENFKPKPDNYFICRMCNFKILCPKYYGQY